LRPYASLLAGVMCFPVAAYGERPPVQPRTLEELLRMPPDELARVDIGLMNLLCAEGLPGTGGLDVRGTVKTLDHWAERVRRETARHLYRVHDPRYADQFCGSESHFLCAFLVQVLQEDFGVHYNAARMNDPDARNSKDLFIHGMIGNDNGGTCISMPVLYVAVGRRLGYPLSLVLAKRHVFCRWDGWGQRLNFDGSATGLLGFPDDEFYHQWPEPFTAAELESGAFLKPLTPTEELALFLNTRGVCLHKVGRLTEAINALRPATTRMPENPNFQHNLRLTETLLEQQRIKAEYRLRQEVEQFLPRLPQPSIPDPRVHKKKP